MEQGRKDGRTAMADDTGASACLLLNRRRTRDDGRGGDADEQKWMARRLRHASRRRSGFPVRCGMRRVANRWGGQLKKPTVRRRGRRREDTAPKKSVSPGAEAEGDGEGAEAVAVAGSEGEGE